MVFCDFCDFLKEDIDVTIAFEILEGVIKIEKFWFGRDDPTQEVCSRAGIKFCINNTMHVKQNENGKKWCDNDKECKFKACKLFEMPLNNFQEIAV